MIVQYFFKAPPQASIAMPNRLISEKSPYLLQHAHNPVDWRPWGDEAFAAAKRDNKPIFLSIGYSTCHWCHVMEKESFENLETAKILNDHFISIKLDREERPDIDRVYMSAVQAMTGQGGWPLSVFLTPELKPFFGGTYFPPEPRWHMPGFPGLLEEIAALWKTDDAALRQDAARLTEALRTAAAPVASADGDLPDMPPLQEAFGAYESSFDAENGGFGGAPKFPLPVNQHFLFRYWALTGDKKALDMALLSLRRMAQGGVFDHLGGGFHRYSTDGLWRVPHFEKMLYDNAQLAVNYLEAFQITGEARFERTTRSVLDYLLRDMRHPEGGFFCAEDADSLPVADAEAKEEGAFYLWTEQELRAVLGPDADAFCAYYGVEAQGNAVSDPHGELRDKNVLYETSGHKIPASQLAQAKAKILALRQKRPRPARDEKIVTSWNGLAISALAQAGRILEDENYLAAAAAAATFVRENLGHEGVLYRRWAGGERAIRATSDDYAFLIQGLLDLFAASNAAEWLQWALRLFGEQKKNFWAEPGGFYLAADGGSDLLFRVLEDADNVEPCASSVSALNALRLHEFTGRMEFLETADAVFRAFSQRMRAHPLSLPVMLAAVGRRLKPNNQIILSGPAQSQEFREMSRLLRRRFLPSTLVVEAAGADFEKLRAVLPWLEPYVSKNRAAAYLCENFSCQAPVHDARELESLLSRRGN